MLNWDVGPAVVGSVASGKPTTGLNFQFVHGSDVVVSVQTGVDARDGLFDWFASTQSAESRQDKIFSKPAHARVPVREQLERQQP